jgi:hypothetical protein
MHYAWGTAPRFIEAPDGWDNEPTLWDATNPARPVAVLQRRDLGHAAHYWPHLVTALTTDDIDRAIATNRRKDAAHDRMHSHTRGEL